MSRTIFIFEDDEDTRLKFRKELKRRLRDTKIISIDGENDRQDNQTYECQLQEIFQVEAQNGAFIISDKDLSNLGNQFRGLSGTTVANVADDMGFPLCLYARGEGQQHGEEFLRSLAPWEKKRIIIEFKTEKEGAEKSAHIFRAFSDIEKKYLELEKKDRSTPAAALSKILNKPNLEDRIALYGTGEQGFLQEIMPYLRESDKKTTDDVLTKRMPRILGYWLYTSILRFPGILVNETAAASYLNISINDFAKEAIQKLFKRAKYTGPFSALEPMWWRHGLDELVFNNNCEDGKDYAQKKNKKDIIAPCDDPETNERAGYYCMVTRTPVSEKNSKSGISWFPGGADLARIRKKEFDELAPWIGLY